MLVRIFKLSVSALVVALDALANAAGKLLHRSAAASCVVLYYHGVRKDSRVRFARQMDLLRRLTEPMDVDTADRLPDTGRYSAVTFDDGFMSVVEYALPELESRNIPCTIFVPTGALGNPPSWIEASHDDADEWVASADKVRELSALPLVRIGSHSVSHPNFRKLDDARALEEMVASRRTLEQITGRSVASFSFPHGAYTQRSIDLARQSGYRRVFTIEPFRVKEADIGFSVGRIRVEPEDWPLEFRLKLLGAYRWMVPASRIKRRIKGLLGSGLQESVSGA